MLRRDGRLFRRGILPALVLSVLLTAAFAAAGFSVLQSAEEEAAPVRVALIDEEGGLLSRVAISMVESQIYMESLLSFDKTNEANALAGLEAGQYAAAIFLPRGYINAITSGESAVGRIVLSRAAAGNADTVAAVARFGERLLSAGQYGVFAGQKLLRENGSDELMNGFLKKSNTALIAFALDAYGTAFQVQSVPYAGTGLSAPAWYALAWSVLLLFICGLFFTDLYTADFRKPLLVRLYASGLRPAGFFLGKLFWPFLYRLLLAAGLFFGLSRLLPLDFSAESLFWALAGLLLLSCMTSSVCVLLADRGFAGPVLSAVFAGLFLCGGLMPRGMLPEALLRLGDFTPFGAAAAAFSPLFGGKIQPLLPAAGLLYTLVFLLLALRRLQRISLRGGAA